MNVPRKSLVGWVSVLALILPLIACQTTRSTSSPELQALQGSWEGEGAGGKCAITIDGRSLHYRAGTNWWKTTFTLPPGTVPRQLHATITDSSPPPSVGTTVFALFKVEDGEFTLAVNDGADEAPADFASASSRYVLRKVQP